MNMNKYPSFYILSSADEKNINNNIQENFGVIFLHAINPFIMKSEKQNLNPRYNLPQVYGGIKSLCQFLILPTYNFL